jgi:hypothetical protein
MLCRAAKSSFGGRGGLRLSVIAPPSVRYDATAIRYSVPAVAVNATEDICALLCETSFVSAPTLVPV